MENSSEIEILSQHVIEFFSTNNEFRRRELQNFLDRFQDTPDSWRLAIELFDPQRPVNVQFYGAKVIYHATSKYFEQIAENIDNIDSLKQFFVHILTIGAHSLPHSVFNKLSSGLALFVLNSLPDIWADPFNDLTLLWSTNLELLLRVFAEIATEFHRLSVPLDQRNSVKAELQKAARRVVQIAQHVLEDAESPASLRNAAIECVEQWLKLPGQSLADYMSVFNAVFNNIGNDFAALSRILYTIKSNEELAQLPRFVWQIAHFVAHAVCPLVNEELDALAQQGGPQLADGMSELVPLIASVVEFCHDFTRNIVAHVCAQFDNPAVTQVFTSICHFFFQLSTLGGIYPVDENISDLAEPWWYSLREELLQPDQGPAWSGNKQRLRDQCAKLFLDMARLAVPKLTVSEQVLALDKEALEQFEAYRVARSDVSSNAVQMAPDETVQLLAGELNAALDARDPERSEAVLCLIKEAADFLNESHLGVLLPALQRCAPLEEWTAQMVPARRLCRFGRAFLELVKSTEHLLLTADAAQGALPALVQTILSYLQLAPVEKLALETLVVLMRNREGRNPLERRDDVVDLTISKCYAHFAEETRPQAVRLLAMRCVGVGLSFKRPEVILESLNQILAPRLVQLNTLASDGPSAHREDAVLFELSVLAQLVATLETEHQGKDSATEPSDGSSPVRLVLDQTLPLLNKLLLANHTPSDHLVAKLCEVLRAGLKSLYTRVAPLLDTYLGFLDAIIDRHPGPACELAKALFLTFHREHSQAPQLVAHLTKWYANRSALLEQHKEGAAVDLEERDEKLVELAYHVVRKSWETLLHAAAQSEAAANDVACFLHCLCFLLSTVIERSRNVALLQESLRTLNVILRHCASTDNALLLRCVDAAAERAIAVVFGAIGSELHTANVSLLADILHHFAAKYPQQTRTTVSNLPGANSPLVSAMFGVQSAKNFRLRTLQMHQAALLQKVAPNNE